MHLDRLFILCPSDIWFPLYLIYLVSTVAEDRTSGLVRQVELGNSLPDLSYWDPRVLATLMSIHRQLSFDCSLMIYAYLAVLWVTWQHSFWSNVHV